MKAIFSAGLAFALCGCALITSTTTTTDPDTHVVKRTHMTGYALFDATAAFSAFNNSTNGTSIGQVNESASSTNLNAIISSVVSGAVQGAIKAAK